LRGKVDGRGAGGGPQVLINIFFFFTIAGESIFQTAQAIPPPC
jgi:hypothetical protein